MFTQSHSRHRVTQGIQLVNAACDMKVRDEMNDYKEMEDIYKRD